MINFKNRIYEIEEFFSLVKDKRDRSSTYNPDYFYSVYGAYNLDQKFLLGMKIFVGDIPTYDEDDSERYPDEVITLNFSLLSSCEMIQDVVDLAISQKPNASYEELIQCLNFYSRNDNFLDLKTT
jgi:hypothetical protein